LFNAIWSHNILHGNTYKNCEPQQWFICHYNFSQIANLKKATGKQTFFCFNAALGTLHKLPYKHCCTTLKVFIWLTVKCSSTCTEWIVALPLQQWLCKNATMLCYMYTVNLLRVPLRLNYPRDSSQRWTNIHNDIFPKNYTRFCTRAEWSS
jgi:hypothetical protein